MTVKATCGLALSVAATLPIAACGGDKHATGPPTAPTARASAPFAWFKPGPPPPGWRTARTVAATLAYPPGWSRAHADVGAVTATLQTGNHFHGYLNATPRQASEQLAGWARFRTGHNTDDGDKQVTVVASAESLPFTGGRGSCVIDDYLAKVGTVRYREIACYVVGRSGGTVLIAATPLGEASSREAILEQAVSHFAVN